MGFLEDMASDAANEVAQLGSEAATYTAAGGSGVAVTPVIVREPTEREETRGGQTVFYRARLKLLSADVAAPAIGDKVNFDSRDFAVVSVEGPVGGMSELRVEAVATDERAQPNYRVEPIGG